MSISKDDFINSAKVIIQGNNEIDYRNASSRAYYGAFHEAERISKIYSNGIIDAQVGMHERVIKNLKTHTGFSKTDLLINQIAALLAMCKKQRVKADYHLMKKFHQFDAKAVISMCETIINLTSKNFP
jgi:uncharacterized protein (UPF0332 family)